jgi:uncharacterized damage-inducible protein DinB
VNTEDISTLYAYNCWANRRVLEMVRPIGHDHFTRDLGTSHGSIRGTLVHTLWAEWIWLQRWRGESPKRVFDPKDFPDVAAVEARWEDIERDRQALIDQVTEERLQASITYENLQGQRWTYSLGHMMQHVVNHSSYHRGQVVTLLRQCGHAAQPTDFLVYLDESGPTPASP